MVVERRVFNVEPEVCPQAVIDWCSYADESSRGDLNGKEIKKKAKGHLAAVGWTFWQALKRNRWELRYTSPSGKSHYSLRMACKTCVDEGGANPGSASVASAAAVSAEDDQGCLVPEKVETPDEYFHSTNSNSASSLSPMKTRKRKLDSEPVQCEPSNTDHQTSQEQLNEKIMDQASVATLNETETRTKKRHGTAEQGGNKRVRKIPHTRGRSNNSSRGPHGQRSTLGAMIDSNAVNLGAKVSYRGKPNSGGTVTWEGIMCDCCSKVFSLTGFEDHVGSTNHRPAANIVLEDGRSLADCKLNKKPTRAAPAATAAATTVVEDDSDDICGVCQDGGDLFLCDSCPSAFHFACLGLEATPDGEWFCASCRCGVCGNGDSSGRAISMMTCRQCERKFHMRCLPGEGGPFCCRKCEEVCLGLRELVGKKISIGRDGLSWTILRCSEGGLGIEAAVEVIHESFEPAIDSITKTDVMEDVFRGRRSKDLSRLNFEGFHAAMLEKEGEVVSVAAVRVCGWRVAEVPLVATKFKYRKMGMCRLLMDEIERQMRGLGVEMLTLPAAARVLRTWVDSFGFSQMSTAQRMELLCYNLLDFLGTVMCQKLLQGETEVKSSALPEDLPTEAKEEPANGQCGGNSPMATEHFMDYGTRGQGRRTKRTLIDTVAKVAAV